MCKQDNSESPPDPAEPLLAVRDLSVVFDTDSGPLTAVDGVSFAISRGEVLGLVGESGCGKSVTALSILRLVPSPPGRFQSGQVRFAGHDLLRLPAAELRLIRGDAISMIFQEPMTALSPLHRVGRQLVETMLLHREMSHREARQHSEAWLDRVGIPDPASSMQAYPFELSGGMRQRVMIAMALLLEPALIIADEPTTALDVTIQAQILDLMLEMRQDDNSLLLITHDMGVIWDVCDRVLVMYAARIVEQGPIRAVFEQPLHPYTQALLQSMPALAARSERLPSIKGQVPSLLHLPAGCSFAERCPHAFARCRHENPVLQPFAGGRQSACFLSEQWEAPGPAPACSS